MNDYPIILAHGIAPFDFIRQELVEGLRLDGITDHLHYFRNIASHLTDHGFEVHHTRVGFAEEVERRAEDLKGEVFRIVGAGEGKGGGPRRVHVIAHSMGGLDARYMIVNLGMEQHVASLTTIGTPHRGTSLADWGRRNAGDDLVTKLRGCASLRGFLDLTTDHCAAFNDSARVRKAEAGNRVFYQTYSSHDERDNVFNPLKPTWEKIRAEEQGLGRDGANDGLVPVASQKWGPEFASEGAPKFESHEFPFRADHLNQLGWWDVSQTRGTKFFKAAGLNPLGWLRAFIDARREYETRVKGLYLKIARDLRGRQLPA